MSLSGSDPSSATPPVRSTAIRSQSPSVAIIGAGPGGLAAALLLAAGGVRVRLFEAADRVGGRTRTLSTPGGYRFDLGPTFFLYPRILSEIFAACGARLEDHVRLIRLDPQYRLVFEGGGRMDATGDVDRMEAEVARIAPTDARNVRRFLDENRRKLRAFKPVLERPFHRLTDMVAPEVLAALGPMRPHRSVETDLRRLFADPRVRLAFSFQAKYLGMSPFRCPSLFTILSFLEHEHGVFHPLGGCGAVTQAMADLAIRLGVELHLSTPVDRIAFAGDRVCGVEAAGTVWRADAVVVNGDFAHVVPTLVPERLRPRWPDRRITKARLSCSTVMFYWGIEGTLPQLPHHTIVLAEDYRRNLMDIEEGRLTTGPSLYVQHASGTDPTLQPPGHSTLYVLVPAPNLRAGIDWTSSVAAVREQVMTRLRFMGVPELASRIRYEKVVTPSDWQSDYGVHQGATFNLSHDLGQMLYFRPHNRFVAGGIYLVGGGTHPGSGLPVIFEGARITARVLMRDLGVVARGLSNGRLVEQSQAWAAE